MVVDSSAPGVAIAGSQRNRLVNATISFDAQARYAFHFRCGRSPSTVTIPMNGLRVSGARMTGFEFEIFNYLRSKASATAASSVRLAKWSEKAQSRLR
ncbi:MAG: hypothetical protein FWE48_03065 [Coriobacteriia bacterium]|nr:hypothetical protein [Coriobacteriia bacterium]